MKQIILIPFLLTALFSYSQIQTINTSTPNSGMGDNAFTAFTKTNSNFTYVVDALESLQLTQADSILIYNYVNAQLAGKQPLDADLNAIAALSPANDDIIQRKANAWVNRTLAQLKTDLEIGRAHV